MEQQQLKNTITKGPAHECDLVSSVSSSSCSSSSSSASGISNGSSLESDSFEEEVTSPSSSSSDQLEADPLSDMSSLFQQLPIKRGLSKYYQGKSQSFTSLAHVRSLEDLVKPENPYNKKLKSCRSYGGGLDETHRAKCTPNYNDSISRHVTSRKGLHPRGSCSSILSAKRGSANLMSNRPPIPPHRSTNTITNQTALFA